MAKPDSKKNYFSHSSSIVDEGVIIGAETKIWHFCHVSNGAVIGSNCTLGQNVFVSGKSKIGNFVKIQNNVSVYDGVTLEDYVFCGPSMVFTNDINPRAKYPKKGNFLPTLIKEGASIGANVTIVCGVTVGKHAFIGSGAVVSKNVPDYALVYGVPGKQHGWMCECGTKLKFEGTSATCATCSKKYRLSDETISEQ